MRNKKLSKVLLFIIPFLILSLSLFGLPYIEAFVLNNAPPPTLTPTITTPTTTFDFRDNMNKKISSATLFFSSPTLTPGSNEITVINQDANIDLTSLSDTILVSVNSTTSNPAEAIVTLFETSDPGVFKGNVILSSSTTTGNTVQVSDSDSLSILYVPFPSTSPIPCGDSCPLEVPLGRLSASIGISSGSGKVTITDFLVINKAQVDCTFTLVTNPVQIDLPSGVTTNSFSATISYANGDLQGAIPTQLRMLYSPIPTNPTDTLFFTSLTPPGPPPIGLDISKHDFINFKITNISAPPSVEGLYAIGFFDNGCSGGGGGGLVRPGLVVNALGGISAAISGGGGGGPPGPTITLGALSLYDKAVEIISMPQEIRDIALNYDPYTPLELIIDTYEDFDLPFSINENGFVLGGYENIIETQTIEPGEPTEFVLVYYTNFELAHSSLNFNLGPTRTIAGSDTQVLLYKDKPPEIVDPNGNIASFTGSINNESDLKRVATFLVTFSESAELPNPDIVIRSWSDNLSSGDTIIYDAIEIAQPEIVEIADEDIPEPEIQTLKSQYVPIWIKNNAAWWSQELIEDSDFVAGIEYLIQQEIITLTESGTLETNSSDEIPNWIKNNASWWSEDLITEKEFIDGLQWLISNGIIQVTET